MNWESSKALTPLKRDFLERFFAEDQSFFLTGGSALGIFYLEHRQSYDLDFFTTDTGLDGQTLRNRVLRLGEAIGATCRAITTTPDFQRFELRRGTERELLDFVVDRVPQIDPQKVRFGQFRVDTLREILVNKLGTLVHRGELKDLIDLYFLEKHGLDVVGHLAQAQTKEGGLDPAILSHLLAAMTVDRLPAHLLAPLSVAELQAFIRRLQQEFARRAFPS